MGQQASPSYAKQQEIRSNTRRRRSYEADTTQDVAGETLLNANNRRKFLFLFCFVLLQHHHYFKVMISDKENDDNGNK